MVRSTRKPKLRVLDGKNDSSPSENLSANSSSQKEDGKAQESSKDKEGTKQKTQVDIGLDISTSVVGICVVDSKTGAMLYIGHLQLNKFTNEYDKADNFDGSWIKPEWSIRKIYIEEAAKKFSPGFSSADTIMTLGRFNGILSYKIYQLTGLKPVMVNVRSARSKLSIKIDHSDKTKNTKQKVLEIVMALNPSFPWISHIAKAGKFKGQTVYDKVNEDRSDAWIICRGGQLLGI